MKWSRNAKTLNFQVFAPHLDPYGKPFRGDFTAVVPIAWLECHSGRRNLRPSGFSVEVVDENGVEKVATTSLRVKSKVLHMRAVGFTFSRPTIKLKLAR